MSAVTWAKAQRVGNPLAKDVLVALASWADADGYAWSPVAVIAFELEKSERSVQRGLAFLLALEDGPLELSERKHLRDGKLLPVYRLREDRGPANTREALRAERQGPSGGGSGGAGSGPLGVTGLSPQKICGDADDTPRGDSGDGLGVTGLTPDTLKGQGKNEENSQETGAREVGPGAWLDAFDRTWPLWAAATPDGVARPADRAAWIAVCEAGVDAGAVERAARRYLERSPAVKAGRGKGLVRWLGEEGWLQWSAESAGVGAGPERARFAGPPELRAAFVAAKGETWAVSWIDPADWDGQALIPQHGFAFDTLRRDAVVRGVLEALNIILKPRS